ncbi:MAG TPA: proton-conducting transporter membrane subunit [Planctomycetota bacterium]|jgi:hydrogenase-4 component B
MIALLLAAIALLILAGSSALAFGKDARLCSALGVGGVVAACILGLVPALSVLLGGAPESLKCNWSLLPFLTDSGGNPSISFSVGIDPLTAFFLVPIFFLAAVAAIYGSSYLLGEHAPSPEGDRSGGHGGPPHHSLGSAWFFYALTVAGMVMVVAARNAVLFLLAWEVMTVASYFLVTFEHDKEEVRRAGWTYMVASQIGAAFLLALFVVLGQSSGSYDFERFGGLPASTASLAFVLALIGFGTKAGFMPLHVWLPEAHPAAPSHVSALMSGVLLKTGVYGLVRTITYLGIPPAWWGWLLVGIGLTSGVLGVLFALAQHDIKRMLAYSSVENLGIIALGLGTGLLGMTSGSISMQVLGFGGALLHVINHSLFKGLLFLGAGAVARATGTRQLDQLGGLLKRMPWTATAFLFGAVAICGLPPLNGFVSELLIFLGNFYAIIRMPESMPVGMEIGTVAIPALVTIAALGLIGGLAAAAFTKVFGIVFLGEPRSEHAASAREVSRGMRAPMLILACGCVCVGVLAPLVVQRLDGVLQQALGLPPAAVRAALELTRAPLTLAVLGTGVFAGLLTFLVVLRWRLLSKHGVATAGTWDCGYAQPTARMQYTASSFSQPLMWLFRIFVRTKRQGAGPEGLFPEKIELSTQTPDTVRERVLAPMFAGVSQGLKQLRWVQGGRVHMYVLYVALTLLVLLVWKLG